MKLPRTPVTAASRERIVAWLSSALIAAGFLADDVKFSLLLLDQYEAGKGRILNSVNCLGSEALPSGRSSGPAPVMGNRSRTSPRSC